MALSAAILCLALCVYDVMNKPGICGISVVLSDESVFFLALHG